MSGNVETYKAAGLSAVSGIAAIGSIPLEETTLVGQAIAILVSIISGVVSLVKLFKKNK
jgi:hypothetical protein